MTKMVKNVPVDQCGSLAANYFFRSMLHVYLGIEQGWLPLLQLPAFFWITISRLPTQKQPVHHSLTWMSFYLWKTKKRKLYTRCHTFKKKSVLTHYTKLLSTLRHNKILPKNYIGGIGIQNIRTNITEKLSSNNRLQRWPSIIFDVIC